MQRPPGAAVRSTRDPATMKTESGPQMVSSSLAKRSIVEKRDPNLMSLLEIIFQTNLNAKPGASSPRQRGQLPRARYRGQFRAREIFRFNRIIFSKDGDTLSPTSSN